MRVPELLQISFSASTDLFHSEQNQSIYLRAVSSTNRYFKWMLLALISPLVAGRPFCHRDSCRIMATNSATDTHRVNTFTATDDITPLLFCISSGHGVHPFVLADTGFVFSTCQCTHTHELSSWAAEGCLTKSCRRTASAHEVFIISRDLKNHVTMFTVDPN